MSPFPAVGDYDPYAVLVGSARIFGVFTAFPLFSFYNVTALLLASFAIALSIPVTASLLDSPTFLDLDWLAKTGLLLKEMSVGFLIGLFIGIPFRMIELAGVIVDTQRAANTPALFDPLQEVEATSFSALLLLFAFFLFVGQGGLYDVITVAYRSFEAFPLLDTLPPDPRSAGIFAIDLFAGIFRDCFVFVAPFLVLLLLVDITFGFLGRGAGQLPLSEYSNVLKNIAVLLGGVVYVFFLPDLFDATWSAMAERALGFIGGADGR